MVRFVHQVTVHASCKHFVYMYICGVSCVYVCICVCYVG